MKYEALNKYHDINELGDAVSKLTTDPYTHLSVINNLEFYNIKIVYFNNSPHKAMLFWNKKINSPVIALNAFLDENQLNFWVAHELGHLLINYYWSPLDNICQAKIRPAEYCGNDDQSNQNTNEKIIDKFAESYLIPSHLIKPIINNYRKHNVSDFKIINQLMYKFKIPRTRAKERFDDYCYFLKILKSI